MAVFQFIQRLLGRQPKSQLPPFNFARNRYKAKTKWPPNLRELTNKQQFRFERKFKRRLRMKSIRPTWNKWVTIVQWSLIGFITVYSVFFHDFRKDPMNPRPGEQPFDGIRNWVKGMASGMWTHTSISRGARRQTTEEAETAVEEEEEQVQVAERTRAARS